MFRPFRLPGWARRVLDATTEFVYPPACRLCDRELPGSAGPAPNSAAEPEGTIPSRDAVFCEECARGLATDRTTACRQCGASIGPGLDPALPCAFCYNENYAFERVVRLGVYDAALRTACLKIKQAGAEPLAAALAELTWQLETEAFQENRIDVVIPIPQYSLQRLFRPHHAAETLAEVWSRRLQVDLAPHILRKVRWTRPQARLNPTERRSNLRHAFRAKPNSLVGASVLLADDVMTTGTTAHEAARQLRQAGAERIVVAVIARGLGRR